MKKKNMTVLWPAYFDANRSRIQGRRVPKHLAVASPKTEEIQKAARSLGLKAEIVFDARYPKSPWQKTGFLLVSKQGSKTQTIYKIAKELTKLRGQRKF
jgi:signal recognition particle subunit SRP19